MFPCKLGLYYCSVEAGPHRFLLTQHSILTCVVTYICIYIHTYIHIYIYRYIYIYIYIYIYVCIDIYILGCMCVCMYVPSDRNWKDCITRRKSMHIDFFPDHL